MVLNDTNLYQDYIMSTLFFLVRVVEVEGGETTDVQLKSGN